MVLKSDQPMQFEFEPIGIAHTGWIEFYPPYNREEAFVGLDGFSHVWLIFPADQDSERPRQIDQSLVELARIERHKGKVTLHLKDMHLVEGTPILDIKPYLPYADCIPDAVP